MRKNYQVIIVGGGASGLLCAIELTKKGGINPADLLILERTDRVGKKLVSTGNGQGNLFNKNMFGTFYHGDKTFIKEFLAQEKEIDLNKYFYSLGIPTCYAENGRAYPLSKQASSVLDVFREILLKRGVNILCNSKVTGIKKQAQAYTVCVEDNIFTANNLVLAFGGAVGKQFGTDGSSYDLVKSLGHTLTEISPSLVQLKTSQDKIKGLKGLKETALVCLYDNDKLITKSLGDLLFTDYGVSGSAVFQVSSYIRGLKNPILKIEFLPNLTINQVQEILEYRDKLEGVSSDKLAGLLVKRVSSAVQKSAKSSSSTDLAFAIKNFTLKVTGDLGFNYAQVTKGGVKTTQINEKTYQSKINKGLYIIGELLDIDGDCGGYNLAFAFVSAIVSARAIKGE